MSLKWESYCFRWFYIYIKEKQRWKIISAGNNEVAQSNKLNVRRRKPDSFPWCLFTPSREFIQPNSLFTPELLGSCCAVLMKNTAWHSNSHSCIEYNYSFTLHRKYVPMYKAFLHWWVVLALKSRWDCLFHNTRMISLWFNGDVAQ